MLLQYEHKASLLFALFRTAEGASQARVPVHTFYRSWFLWQLGEGEYGDRGPLDMSVQACMFGRPSHDIPASQNAVSRPQVEEIVAAATCSAAVWGGTISPGLNGMSEPDKLQTVGRTGLGQHGHTKDSTLLG